MGRFNVRFTIFDAYIKNFPDHWVVLEHNELECWTEYEVETNLIDTSEWVRKGSLGVDGYFIHDDYRAGGDMNLAVKIEGHWHCLEPDVEENND